MADTKKPPQPAAQTTQLARAEPPRAVGALARFDDADRALIAEPSRRAAEVNNALAHLATKANVLSPVRMFDAVPPYMAVSLRVVEIDPAKDAGDVYVDPRVGKPSLTKRALDKIAAAAGINWDASQCGRTDDQSDPYRVSYRVAGWLMECDGTRRDIYGEKEIDLRDGSALMESMAAKPKQLAGAREHILAMAASKAMNRAIRAAMALKQAYTDAELKRPFVVPKLVPMLDTSDPRQAEVALAAAVGGMAALFGRPRERSQTSDPIPVGASGPSQPSAPVTAPDEDEEAADPSTAETMPPHAPPDDEPPPVAAPPVPEEYPIAGGPGLTTLQRTSFWKADEQTRILALRWLERHSGGPGPDGPENFAALDRTAQLKAYDALAASAT